MQKARNTTILKLKIFWEKEVHLWLWKDQNFTSQKTTFSKWTQMIWNVVRVVIPLRHNTTVLNSVIHSQLLKSIILKFNSSSIALLTMYISYCCHNRVLYWVYTDPYCFIYWAIRKNIAQAARPIRRINSSNIALPGRTILEV